ncbi:MAG TPA: PH domain-containing protein [Actinomycetota bacterium]
MAFPRRLLVDGEELILDLRPHPIALARAVIVTLLVVAGAILALTNLPNGSSHDVLFWLTLGVGLVILVLWPVRDLVRYLTSHFVVTSDRIIHRSGWIAKDSMEIPLEAINDVRFHQGVFERVIGAGSLVIESAGERGTSTFQDIRKPEEVQKMIYHQGELNQRKMMRGAPAAGPAAPSPTTELQRLADLRERGVITEEEFQAQKKRILEGS